ncbi:hypothetical protein WG66_007342 [Moniliophthora roreri]|nr:hypothetical protein WG66_007342 [Moniliophthora roreri]
MDIMPRHTASFPYQDIVDQSRDRALVPPVHHLPPEILGIIFAMFNDPDDPQWLQPSDAEMAPALVVSRTCRRWRAVSLSLPSIWSSLAIRFMEWSLPDYRQLILLTRLFADRSQTHPLNLNLDFDGLFSLNERNDTVVPILRTLVQHSKQWLTVQFDSVTPAVMSHPVFIPISGHLPILTNLEIYGDDGDEEEGLLEFSCDLFRNCPSLTSVCCKPSGPFAVSRTNDHLLAWGQIKSLDIYGAEISDALRMASFGTNLEQLTINNCGGGSYTGGCISVPSVTGLSISALNSDEAYYALEYLTLPRLSSLDICYIFEYYDDEEEEEDEGWDDWDEQHILGLFNRSGCTLTLLCLQGVPISDEQLIQLLCLMPALSSLSIFESGRYPFSHTNRTITRRFLQRLTINDTSSPFLPKLTAISLFLCEDGLVDTVLPNALISRWIPDDSQCTVACIECVIVTFKNKSENESKEAVKILTPKLQFLREQGVWVTVDRVKFVAEDEES